MTDQGGSPAERYAAYRRRLEEEKSELARFRDTLPFELDPFQEEACRALEEGRGVLVAAPTGSGKTVVGLFGVHLALSRGRSVMYTTPIKALSNQKYNELRAIHGDGRVGLLTGDVTINPHAPVLVMTTEVLRNMLYAGSETLQGLDVVVMDEVHYLADRFRGPVWEECIIHLPARVQIISLSATVSNAEEFGQWLTMVRGETTVVVWEIRPVPLWQHVLVEGRLYDLYAPSRTGQERLNPQLLAEVRRRDQHPGRARLPRRRRPYRPAIVLELDRQALLPAICFVFSRAGCEAAVDQLMAAGLDLTTDAEANEIRAVIERRTGGVPREDLGTLGHLRWSMALERGIAAHHAGMIPLFKEVVEELFARGLLKVVFATETLALGINMPARSVVLESLVKWDGSAHQKLTPGEYTQLTGRAGRRGIDVEGHAVVIHTGEVDVEAISGLASKRTYPLRSAFRATYNMSVNLLAAMPRERAREVLQTSFAQFQADRGVVGLARQVRKLDDAVAEHRNRLTCELGDVAEYAAIRREISALERRGAAARTAAERARTAQQLETVRVGDVIALSRGRRRQHAVVHAVTESPRVGVLLDVVADDGRARRVGLEDLPGGVEVIGSIRVSARHGARTPKGRADLAARVRSFVDGEQRTKPRPRIRVAPVEDNRAQLEELRARMRAHPVHHCPELELHLRWERKLQQALADRRGLLERIDSRTGSIAAGFDRLCQHLQQRGYLEGETVTDAGQLLRHIYSERDLLMAQCLREGVWTGLSAAELAGAISLVVYESRNDMPSPVDVRSEALRRAIVRTNALWADLHDTETRLGIEPLPAPDPGLAGPISRWAAGQPLASVLGEDLLPGDFVRWSKQVMDILDQLAKNPQAPPALRSRAHAALAAVNHGIVALSSV